MEFTKTLRFPNTGKDFSGWSAAIDWCQKNGYSYGAMQAGSPCGIAKGNYTIEKWRNLSDKDILRLDGIIESDDERSADVVINLK